MKEGKKHVFGSEHEKVGKPEGEWKRGMCQQQENARAKKSADKENTSREGGQDPIYIVQPDKTGAMFLVEIRKNWTKSYRTLFSSAPSNEYLISSANSPR